MDTMCAGKREKPIIDYLKEIKMNDKFLYKYNSEYSVLVIFTKRPECWIGWEGEGESRFKQILKDYWGHEVEVTFMNVSINGGFLDVAL